MIYYCASLFTERYILTMNRFNCILQHDSMQCGAACLSMICKHYGIPYPIEHISNICPATSEGVSMLGLSETAQILGFSVTNVKTTTDLLSEETLPMILYWNQNHFVVLYRIKKNKFYIADPGKGLVKYSLKDFEKNWISTETQGVKKGIAMVLEPGKEFDKHKSAVIAQNRTKQKSFGFLFNYIKQYGRYFTLILMGLILGCILQLILPFLTQSIVDIGINNNDINFIWLVLIGELMIILGRTAVEFIRRWLLLHISMRINISLVSDFFIKLLKLKMSFFDTKLMGDLLQRISDHSRVQSFLTNQVLSVIFSSFSFIILGIVLLIYNKLIFFVFLICSIVYGLWITVFLRRRKVIDYELFEQQSINHNKTYQFITAMQEIKLQDCEQRRRWEWEDVQADLFQVQMKSLKLQQTQEAGAILINEVKNILITVLAATAVIEGNMTLGMMLAVQYIIGQLNSPVEQFMNFIYSMQDVKISLERINEIHTAKEENDDEEQYVCSFSNDNKTIDIDSVDFKYDPFALNKTIDNVSFHIPEGKVTAIVGASGSGKTTLIKLMLGYYSVTSGNINIAGNNINEYNMKWWRRQCGVVMQDGVIFSESIARNIAVSDDDIDTERLETAAKIANIHEYIMSLPLKYNTIIGKDGIGLSQGQKQRILIARAVYKDPKFIFLDEATNALDAKNERVIVENLNKFYESRTVIVVAHRLSTVKNADQIIVLEQGKIVEIGDHVSLIEKHGTYYNLVKNQLELGN